MNSTSLVYCSSEMTQDLVYLIDPFTTLSYILAKEGVVKMNLILFLRKVFLLLKLTKKKMRKQSCIYLLNGLFFEF